MTKPKGKTPSLLTQSTGKPVVHICKRKTVCSRCKEDIVAGDKCIKIPKQISGFQSPKLYCTSCFELIIAQTKKDLLMIENAINKQEGGAETLF